MLMRTPRAMPRSRPQHSMEHCSGLLRRKIGGVEHLLKPFVAAAAILVWAQAALAQNPVITQRHAYEGKQRPTEKVATVFAKILGNRWTMIQKVDGKEVRGLFESGCCDVVYVPPGKRQIFVHFGILGRGHASATLTGNLAAGRVYEAEANCCERR